MNASDEPSSWRSVLFWALFIFAAVQLAGWAWVLGAAAGAEKIRQQAVDEGYGVRDPDFRWRSGNELKRTPAKREKTQPKEP